MSDLLTAPAPPPALDPDYAEQRKTRLGATDIVAALGLSKHTSPLTLWARKTGRLEEERDDDGTGPAAQGQLFESTIAQLYANRTGHALYSGGVSTLGDWATCQIDRIAKPNDDGGTQHAPAPWIVEIKMRDRWSREAQGWGADGSLDVPRDVLVQVLMQQLMSELTETADVVCYADRELRVLRVPFDRELAEAISVRAYDWWKKHVKGGAEPKAGHAADLDWLKRKVGDLVDEPITVDDFESELGAWVWEYAHVNIAYKTVTERRDALKALIAQHMGDRKKLISTVGSISYGTTTVGRGTNWQDLARELAQELELTPDQLAQRIRAHTSSGRLQRSFRFTPKQGA